MNRLVIVGCGRLAEIITNAVVKGMLPDYELVGVYSRTASKAEHIANKMRQHGKMCAACHTLKELLERKPFNEEHLQWEKIHINKFGGK